MVAPARFEFATAGRIVFGAGVVAEAAAAAASMGRRALLVTGSDPSRAGKLAGPAAETLPVQGEPTVPLVREGAACACSAGCDVVIAIGGGSAIDAGKAVAAMLANPGDPLDYLEVVGRGQPLKNRSFPFIAIPTTAGTGSEVTRNAVLASPEHGVKASLRSPGMLPALALVDPDLTLGLPPDVTAATGLDALTQLIEPYVSVRANPMTDMFCLDGIRHAAWALPRAWQDGGDREARSAMSWASLLGGLALANAALGAVHGFAAPAGGMFPAPHGAACAALLPYVIEVNIRALRERSPASAALARYSEIARLLTGNPRAEAEEGGTYVATLCRRFGIPSLGNYGVARTNIPELAAKAGAASSMKGNPIALSQGELEEIATRAAGL